MILKVSGAITASINGGTIFVSSDNTIFGPFNVVDSLGQHVCQREREKTLLLPKLNAQAKVVKAMVVDLQAFEVCSPWVLCSGGLGLGWERWLNYGHFLSFGDTFQIVT